MCAAYGRAQGIGKHPACSTGHTASHSACPACPVTRLLPLPTWRSHVAAALPPQLICRAFDLLPATAPRTYPALGAAAGGRRGRRAVLLFCFLELAGASIVLLMVCWQMLELLLPSEGELGGGEGWWSPAEDRGRQVGKRSSHCIYNGAFAGCAPKLPPAPPDTLRCSRRPGPAAPHAPGCRHLHRLPAAAAADRAHAAEPAVCAGQHLDAPGHRHGAGPAGIGPQQAGHAAAGKAGWLGMQSAGCRQQALLALLGEARAS